MKKLLCCGDREWTNREVIHRELALFPPDTVVIHGACRGADTLCGEVALALGFLVHIYPARWERHGKAAGPLRNQQMLTEEQPTDWLAFHEDITRSKGTIDMIRRLRAASVPGNIIAK